MIHIAQSCALFVEASRIGFIVTNFEHDRNKELGIDPITKMGCRAYSTVTDLAKFLGWSTLHPLITAMWYDNS